MRDRLPSSELIGHELTREPTQVEVKERPFTVETGGMTYTVSPLYTYEITGLVVSQHQTDSLFDYYHDLWGDTFNVKDVCIVWGENALSGIYKNLEFKNGSWTCYVRTDSRETWSQFNMDEFSNNHLLTASPKIKSMLDTIRPGDQVRIKGHLVSYSHASGFERGTSITRTDTGNGACETIYISEVQILSEANPQWKDIFTLSYTTLVAVTVLRVLLFLLSATLIPRRK